VTAVASHLRSRVPHQATTVAEHRPKPHQEHLAWTPSRIIYWAGSVGPAPRRWPSRSSPAAPIRRWDAALASVSCGSASSTGRSGRRPPPAALGACTYQSLKSILERQLDQLPLETPTAPPAPVEHDNLRGPDYFQMQ
jgi:hypothetical protein